MTKPSLAIRLPSFCWLSFAGVTGPKAVTCGGEGGKGSLLSQRLYILV